MTTAANASAAAGPITGRAVYIFSYDVAYDTSRQTVRSLLGQAVTQYQATPIRGPRQQFFYSPQMVTLSAERRIGPGGPVEVVRRVKLFPIGALSITYHVPFSVDRIEQLCDYHDVELDGRAIQQDARELADRVVRELGAELIRPVPAVRDEEAYTVFCLDAACLGGSDAEAWLADNRRRVAGLLNDDDGEQLSDTEARDTVGNFMTYHRDDLVVMDWDAAIVIDQPAAVEEVLHVMELACLQSAELEAYDRFLDEALDRSYRDLSRPRGGQAGTLKNLREIRLDLSRLSDELQNTTKFFGDWHLAQVYQRLFVLFHLNDWQKAIDEKLHTLGDLYHLLQQDRNNRAMMALEIAIVLLFIIDVIMLFTGLGK